VAGRISVKRKDTIHIHQRVNLVKGKGCNRSRCRWDKRARGKEFGIKETIVSGEMGKLWRKEKGGPLIFPTQSKKGKNGHRPTAGGRYLQVLSL